MANLPDGTPIPPIPNFPPPPPPPPPQITRKRQRGSSSKARVSVNALPVPSAPIDDGEANYVVYPSDDDEEGDVTITQETVREREHADDDVEGEDVLGGSGDEYQAPSESEFSEDLEAPQRKRAKAGDDSIEALDDGEDVEMEDSNNNNNNNNNSMQNLKSRKISQNWRNDVYKPPPSSDPEDSDLELKQFSPGHRRGKRKSGGKAGSSLNASIRKNLGAGGGLVRSKTKSTPNLNPDKTGPNKIRKSRFFEGSMGDRTTRPGGVPPFKNFEPSDEDETGAIESNGAAMGPPPSKRYPGKPLPQSTPPPPKSKFNFWRPFTNWFGKKWAEAAADFEHMNTAEEEKQEIESEVKRILNERKKRAEGLWQQGQVTKTGGPTITSVGGISDGGADKPQEIPQQQYSEEIGVAVTTNDVYVIKDPVVNGSSASVATVKPVDVSKFPLSPRSSTDTTGSYSRAVGVTSNATLAGFTQYRDNTPATQDTQNSDVETFRSRSRSPIPPLPLIDNTPSKPLTKAEQKKKERLEKKMEEFKKKLADTQKELSLVLCEDAPVKVEPPAAAAVAVPAAKPDVPIPVVEVEDTEDEAEKIIESIVGEPELIATVRSRSRSRSKSPFKRIFGGSKTTAKDAPPTPAAVNLKNVKPVAHSTPEAPVLHAINVSGKIRKPNPASMRGRGGGRGGGSGRGRGRGKRGEGSPM